MLELFLECMPEYNIDRPDGEGKHSVVNHREYAEIGLFTGWFFYSARPLGNSDTWNFFEGMYMLSESDIFFRQHSFVVGLY